MLIRSLTIRNTEKSIEKLKTQKSKKNKMLELPMTLRLAKKGEVPSNSSVEKRMEASKNAKIIEGYKIIDNDKKDNDIPFEFYCEININNSRLWNLIKELANELPEMSALIFHEIDTEVKYGKYVEKIDLLLDIVKFKKELVKDTFLEWGIIYSDNEKLIEIFITETKYIKFWGIDKESFRRIMKKFNLDEIEGIEFVDEYPRIREVLYNHDKSVSKTEDVIEELRKKFIE